MLLRVFALVIIFFATFKLPDSRRTRQVKVDRLLDAVQSQTARGKATNAASGVNADSAGLVVTSASNVTARRQPGIASNLSSSAFSTIFEYVGRMQSWNRLVVLKVACSSAAFTCEEIVQLADVCSTGMHIMSWAKARWVEAATTFAKGRNHTGCISDPGNAKSIVESFKRRWLDIDGSFTPAGGHPASQLDHVNLQQAFIGNSDLKPAKGVASPPLQLHKGLRSDEDMKKLLENMEALLIFKYSSFYQGHYDSRSLERDMVPSWLKSFGSPEKEFETWLKQIRSSGEQFSGPQLATLAHAITEKMWRGLRIEERTLQAVFVLLQYLQQYVSGVTCNEVSRILQGICSADSGYFASSFEVALKALRPNIVDGQNKLAIIATGDPQPLKERWPVILADTILLDVGAGLPPKNNPVFGVVIGNPVIFVVDESTWMDTFFVPSDHKLSRRKFCHSQLETVLEGLPTGTHFNVIRYSSSAVKIFGKAVLVSKSSIDTAMGPVSCRGGIYSPGQDPADFFRNIKIFALEYRHHFNRSTKINSMEALQLAYGAAELPSPESDDQQHSQLERKALNTITDSPQIYFLTSGQPDSGARQILDQIPHFDGGRSIPVNSISWIQPADLEAKQFVKDLANKTGGFFRPIEQASLQT